jgi:hypothetical protein
MDGCVRTMEEKTLVAAGEKGLCFVEFFMCLIRNFSF